MLAASMIENELITITELPEKLKVNPKNVMVKVRFYKYVREQRETIKRLLEEYKISYKEITSNKIVLENGLSISIVSDAAFETVIEGVRDFYIII